MKYPPLLMGLLALLWAVPSLAMMADCKLDCTPENVAVLNRATALLPAQFKVGIKHPIQVRFVTGLNAAGATSIDSEGRIKFPIDVQISTKISFEEKVRAVVHEFSHVYDMIEPLSAVERTQLSHCDRGRPSDECQRLQYKLGRISFNGQFLALNGWRLTSRGSPELLNQLRSRSPDLNEFKDPQEAFATAMEYFILDPQYSCRRPATFRYLRNLFEHDPFPNAFCRSQPIRIFQSRDEKDAPDLSRLAAVDLLFAAPGREVATRWGHVMYRLVICGPERKQISDDCRKDVSEHLVISPRGAQDELQASTWKLLTGGYNSEFFILDFPRVVREYTRTEFRDVELIPLLLSQEEVRAFGEAVVERFWGYQGSYSLFSNNCATEALSLLQAATPNPKIQQISSAVLTPKKLVEQIRQVGVAASESDRIPSRLGSYLLSIQELGFIDWMKGRFPQRFPPMSEYESAKAHERDLALELLDWSPAARQAWGEFLMKNASAPRVTAAHLYVIEDLAEGRLRQKLEQGALKIWWDARDEEARKSLILIRPQADPGYGIPMPHELQSWGVDISQEILVLAKTRQAELFSKWNESVVLRKYWGLKALSVP